MPTLSEPVQRYDVFELFPGKGAGYCYVDQPIRKSKLDEAEEAYLARREGRPDVVIDDGEELALDDSLEAREAAYNRSRDRGHAQARPAPSGGGGSRLDRAEAAFNARRAGL